MSATVWRRYQWLAPFSLLVIPLVMMQISRDWHWTLGTFVAAAVVIGGISLMYELAGRMHGSRAYRAAIVIALVAGVLTLWTMVQRDDGNGASSLMLVMAAAVGAFAAWLQPLAMARAMLGVAVMQIGLGVLGATAPSTASVPDGAAKMLGSNAIISVLWLVSAYLFHTAAQQTDGKQSA